VVDRPAEPYLRMEAVLIAAEVGGGKARDLLMAVVTSPDYSGQEVRQAAVWGLGESGCTSYLDLIPFLADADPEVALHAICAFAAPLPLTVGSSLVGLALRGNPREQAAAREVLRMCGGRDEIRALAVASETDHAVETAALASLATFTREHLADAAVGNNVLARHAPMRMLLDHRENWLAVKEHVDFITSLASQTVHARRDER
jgi:HEAT repeat protein